MTELSSHDIVEVAARAIMLDDGCGLTIEGERAFCDDPRALEPHDRCYCKRSARAAIDAINEATAPARCSAGTSPASVEYTNEQIALRMDQTYEACGDRWFKIAADRLRATQPAVPRKWDEGEHEGCGIDSQRALERQSRLSAGGASARQLVTLYVPDGYASADEFLKDCQFERAEISTSELLETLVKRLQWDGSEHDLNSITIGEMRGAI